MLEISSASLSVLICPLLYHLTWDLEVVSSCVRGQIWPSPLHSSSGWPFVSFGYSTSTSKGLPRWLNGKESTCQCWRCRRCRFDPWVGKIPLEEEMVIHSNILAWKNPWTEEPDGLGLQRVRHSWACTHCRLHTPARTAVSIPGRVSFPDPRAHSAYQAAALSLLKSFLFRNIFLNYLEVR